MSAKAIRTTAKDNYFENLIHLFDIIKNMYHHQQVLQQLSVTTLCFLIATGAKQFAAMWYGTRLEY